MRITVTPTDGEPQVYEALAHRYEGVMVSDQVLVISTTEGEVRVPLVGNWIQIGD